MAEVWINADYAQTFASNKLMVQMLAQQGEVYREGAGRVTLRFERNGNAYFLKRHTGIGWREIIKDLTQLRLPVLGATNEWRALRLLQEIGISSLIPVAYGCWGWNPARQQSFLITAEMTATQSLEDVVLSWEKRDDFIAVKRHIIRQTAILTRHMHEAGMNHRDLYICHLYVADAWLQKPQGEPDLQVIDLHRAQIRRKVPPRWRVKDVASLYFSSMEAGLTKRDFFRFMRDYTQQSLRQMLTQQADFWRAVQARADRLYATRPGSAGDRAQ